MGVLECVFRPPGKIFKRRPSSQFDYHIKNRIEILCKEPVRMPRDLFFRSGTLRKSWNHRTLARMSTDADGDGDGDGGGGDGAPTTLPPQPSPSAHPVQEKISRSGEPLTLIYIYIYIYLYISLSLSLYIYIYIYIYLYNNPGICR